MNLKSIGNEEDITPEDDLPIGKNILELTNIQTSANYTCVASSVLGDIEAIAVVKVQCELNNLFIFVATYFLIFFLFLFLCSFASISN